MFATRISRKAKVMRVHARLERQQAAAAQPAAARHDSSNFLLGGPGTCADIKQFVGGVHEDLAAFAKELRLAGGLQAAVRDRVRAEPGLANASIDFDMFTVHDYAVCWGDDGKRMRVHARRKYYGSHRYDWVSTVAAGEDGEDTRWYGRLLALFSCDVGSVCREFALIKWLDVIAVPRDHVVGATHYAYWAAPPKVELLTSVYRRAKFLTSPLVQGAHAVFLVLPYADDGTTMDD